MVSVANDAGGEATTMLGGRCRACAAQGRSLTQQAYYTQRLHVAKRLLQHALPHLPHLAPTTNAAAWCAPSSPAPPYLARAFERG